MEKTTQLCTAVVRLQPPSAPGTKQLDSAGENNSTREQERNNSTQQEKTTQLVSRNETTQLCTAVDRLHRLYSRIGFFYLLTINKAWLDSKFILIHNSEYDEIDTLTDTLLFTTFCFVLH
ncbi:hypothetical protein TNCV_4788321 [Trichonephila clavipes]|nr:hypothetical protein TNCV_4788321 [Trichonephila clavipes]